MPHSEVSASCDYCETYCQLCESCQSCETFCQDSCQTACESACQSTCQLGCQSGCEVASQSANHFEWDFCEVSAASNTTDTVVRGLWSGFVDGQEVLCAACNGYLWQLARDADGAWSKTACGAVDTEEDVFMFGFEGKLYLLNGSEYKVWDGAALTDVSGVQADGGGQRAALRRWDGARAGEQAHRGAQGEVFAGWDVHGVQAADMGLKSIDYVKHVLIDMEVINYDTDLVNGTVTISPALPEGTNSIEVGWTVYGDTAEEILAMRYAELYNGSQDTRVFIYGDGTNRAFYSGIDFDGAPRADYFPDLNVAHVGDENTPITAMIRHYDRLLCFKLDSAWSIGYSQLTLADGTVTAGFYVSPVNRSVGNCAPGQAVLVENRPRTLDGRSVVEWKSTSSSGNINGDERNAERISQRVEETIRSFDLSSAKTFYDKYAHEYYVIGTDGTALVHGIDADAWYVYTNFDARCPHKLHGRALLRYG